MISRRSILKAAIALPFAPLIRLRPTVDREAILRRFCSDYESRYEMRRPFGVSSLTYATDSKSMVRAELANRIEDGQARLPPVGEAWQKYWLPAGEFIPFSLPSIESLTLKTKLFGVCPLCDDRRVSYGDHYPPSQAEMDSLPDYGVDDNTIRDASCGLCGGRDWNGPYAADIAGVTMEYSRLKPIAAIPGVRVVASRIGDGHEALLFSGGGFEGVAMGLSQ